MRSQHLDPENERETLIAIEGLSREWTLMQITDSHMAAADQRDPDALEATNHYQALFAERTPAGAPTRQIFGEVLEKSNELEVDHTVLTGDIIHFPSHAALETLAQDLGSLRSDYLYTLGNHDWYFPHLEWNDETRLAHYPRLAHLTKGTPAAQAVDLGEVRLLAVDNSNYQISPAQLNFLHQHLDTGIPCLLFVHIPLALPSLMPAMAEVWEDPIVMAASGWIEENRIRRSIRESDQSTLAAHQLLSDQAANLVGIFCGHIHFPHADPLQSGGFQYVTRPCYEGGYRLIRLKPLS